MSGTWQTYWRKVASGERQGAADRCVVVLLAPCALLYSLIQRLRAVFYHSGILTVRRLPRPVISIGNITVGGTGKTPVTDYVARYLQGRGRRVAVLSRGYGGSLEGQTCIVSDGERVLLTAEECGDEPYLLASTVPGLMVVIGADRYRAGQLAMQQLAPDIFLLDDGYQHMRLHRDLNILLLDYSRPFGNGLTLPVGMLREPLSAMQRADCVVFTRVPEGADVRTDTRGIMACVSSHTITDLLPLDGGSSAPFSAFSGNSVLAFAGIADPESFFAGLRVAGLNLVRCISFPDHVVYTDKHRDELVEAMRESGADLLITTEKDGVKLKGFSKERGVTVLLARLKLTIDDPAGLNGLLNKVLDGYKP